MADNVMDAAVQPSKPKPLALKPLAIPAKSDAVDMEAGAHLPSVLSSVEVGGGMSRLDDVIAKRLLDAHAKARKRKRRITGISLGVGSVTTVIGVILLFTQVGVIGTFGIFLIACGTYFCATAMLATDHVAIRVSVALFALLTAAISYYASMAVFMQDSSFITNPSPCFNATLPGVLGYCIAQNMQYYVDFSTYIGCVITLLWASRPARDAKGNVRFAIYPRVALGRVWLTARTITFNSGCGWLLSGLLRVPFSSDIPGSRNEYTSASMRNQLITAFTFLFFALLCFRRVRTSVQKLLAGSGAAAEEASAAASVSAVIGGSSDVGAALAAATRVFRAISFDQLSASDLDSKEAAPDLNFKAVAARLGEIDFFFSHSWHDDPAAKWSALANYSTRFKEDRGRAPLMWLDRACLNQEDIAGSLSHLPVHMAGCKGLVVIAGATYTSRLWTLLELYVWEAMGKEQNRVKMIVIAPDGDTAAVSKTFRSVSIKEAGCSSEADREKILAIVEASYASLKAFDKHVGALLVASTTRRSSLDAGEMTRKASCSRVLRKVATASRLSRAPSVDLPAQPVVV